MNGTLLGRLDEAERQLRALQREVAELRALLAQPEPEPAPAPAPTPVSPPPPPPRAPEQSLWRSEIRLPEISAADLLGARALAWAGGIVTLLGVVFFFALAVNRGWIGPVERVGLGALASTLVLAAGVVARSRYGQLYSALAAAGAGIAGGYATLLAASALYDLVPDLVALAIAAGIAAVGVAFALAWSAQMLAAIGLAGATLVPFSVVFDGGLSTLGTAFAAIVFAATAVVAVREGWRWLLGAGLVASLPQVALLVAEEGEGAAGRVVLVVASFVALYAAAGIVRYLKAGGQLASTLVLTSGALGTAAAPALLNGELLGLAKQGVALLLLGAVYGALAALFFVRDRDLSSLLAAVGLIAGSLGLADLLGGTTLAVVWAVQSAALAWLGRRVLERRFQAASAAYLVLALGHALAFEAPLTDLYREGNAPADGVPALLAVLAGAVLFALHARGWDGEREAWKPFAWFGERSELWRATAIWGAALSGIYAGSLGVLALVRELDVHQAFQWGHVGVAGLWAAAGAALLLVGASRERSYLQVAGLVWLGVATANFLSYDLFALAETQRGWAAAAIALPLLVAGGLGARLAEETELRPVTLGLVGASAALAAYAVVLLLPDETARGVGFLALGAGFGGLATVAFFRDRDLSTVLTAAGLGLGTAASILLLSETELVAAWSVAAAALAWLAVRAGERRLQLGAFAFAGAALAETLAVLAPPDELFVANASPADGAAAVALAATAVAVIAWYAQDAIRRGLAWLAGVLGMYCVSLAILGAVAWLGGADVTTEFQRGHTAVSAFWGLVALVALYVGLTRRLPAIRLAGFGFFGLSLAKIFLYDLSTLSSVTRAQSFLAVGAVLLLAGFFYQRLAEPRSS